MQLKEEYDHRIREAETALLSYEQERKLILENKTGMHGWIREFKQYRNIRSLDRNAAAVMVKRVLIYSADRIAVIYNFEDEFARCREYVAAYGESGERKVI